MLGFVTPVEYINAHTYYKPIPAIYGQAPVAEGGPLPCFGSAGTGGIEGVTSRPGYRSFVIVKMEVAVPPEAYAPYTDLMKEVKSGFGRTMSHLPPVFGVSRQTLYNWLNGEVPKEQHQNKLVQLAAAARVFVETRFKPTALTLDRTVTQGKSFVELLGEGANGKDTAQRLVRIARRGAAAREKLDTLLGDRAFPRPDVSDMGRPFLDENA